MNKIYSIWQRVRHPLSGRPAACHPVEDPLQHLPAHIRDDLPPWHEPAPGRANCRGRPGPSISLRVGVQ